MESHHGKQYLILIIILVVLLAALFLLRGSEPARTPETLLEQSLEATTAPGGSGPHNEAKSQELEATTAPSFNTGTYIPPVSDDVLDAFSAPRYP